MSGKPQVFARYIEQRKEPSRFAAFDLETDGLAGRILGCGWMVEGWSRPLVAEDPAEMVATMFEDKNRALIWYAHNGGGFDFPHLAPHLRAFLTARYGEDGWREDWVMRGDGSVLALTYRRTNKTKTKLLMLRDSMAILPTSLDVLAKGFAQTQKLKGTIDFEGGELWSIQNEAHVAYLENDVESLLQAMCAIRDLFWETFHVNLRLTAASTGLRVFQHFLPKGIGWIPMRADFEDFIRRGKFGGLTFVLSTNEIRDVDLYDVNSLYPFSMKSHDYPVGYPKWSIFGFEVDHSRGHLGMYECIVESEDRDIIPIIPVRNKDGTVGWPIGRFKTVLTTPEIVYGRSVGYHITPGKGVVWREKAPIFRDFVQHAETLKTENPGTPLATLAKLTMNSVYGKFGQNRDAKSLVVSETPPTKAALPVLDPQGNIVPNVWEVASRIESSHIQPQIASYITAYSRIYYHSIIMAAGGRPAVIYGDTDSIMVLTEQARTDRIPIHPTRLGALKHEAHYVRFKATASKTWEGETMEGGRVYRSKGIPRRLRGQGDATLEWDTLRGTRASLRRGTGPTLVHQRRSLPVMPSPDRWVVDPDGSVHPIRVDSGEELDYGRVIRAYRSGEKTLQVGEQ